MIGKSREHPFKSSTSDSTGTVVTVVLADAAGSIITASVFNTTEANRSDVFTVGSVYYIASPRVKTAFDTMNAEFELSITPTTVIT